MGDKEDYLTSYRMFFENFASIVNPEDQLPVQIAGYTITEAELPGEVLYWTTQYLTEKQCPPTLMTPLRRIILDEVQVACKKQPNEFGYKSDSSVYIALRLMQAVTARVIDVCLRYLDNSRLDTLPPPPPPALRELKTVSSATKNSRRVMEDRHVEIGNLEALFGIDTTEPTSFYAVYDGHAGSAAATYCAAHLHQYLVESTHFATDLRRALLDSFLRTDAEFVRKSNQERARGGSTAVAVVVRARRLHAAWAGDSLALLAKRMRLMQLVRPHKPGRQDERDRIESSGGTVMHWGTWRVNGQLAVSRAIGDAQYKPYVTARPEIASVDLDGDEDFVVVACDGLWDFVSEDDVALSVYRQLASDPDDLKAVTKRLIVQAKRQGSCDNISIIVVFLKDPRDIAADNYPPMDLGLDNALASAPPFAVEMDACKRQLDAAAADADGGECADADADADAADNGVDNSDSDSEDLGPETAVDADDVDAESRNYEPAPPTPPAHIVEAGHVDGALLDNVAESGDESEDEWNYFKGEGDRKDRNQVEESDEPRRSETPGQDHSESSSVDMNSSPLNPDAPVFVPGSVASSDVLLAESPRKPMPMDDIELPDVAQFQTEAVIRPAELLDLDNCDHLNGHHNVSINEADKKQFNGNDKCNLDNIGFDFGVGVEPEKMNDSNLIQDFERIQKDTTDFVNIQVFQSHTETNPFAADDNEELFERLKNKERDPMSMSFYQEKDDDTCERLVQNESHVDLNAVQPLPDSDDEDIQPNGACENYHENEKENISPEKYTNLLNTNNILEPNNDIIQIDDRTDATNIDVANFAQSDNFISYNTNNMQNYSNIDFESCNIPQDTVLQTDTPESHKLLFEQIPEIPDGKSSELDFVNEDTQDPSESENDIRVITPQDETSQDVETESKLENSPYIEVTRSELAPDLKKEQIESIHISDSEHTSEPEFQMEISFEHQLLKSPFQEEHKSLEATTPEPTHDLQENVIAEIHHTTDLTNDIEMDVQIPLLNEVSDLTTGTSTIQTDSEDFNAQSAINENVASKVPLPAESPLPTASPVPPRSPAFSERPLSGASPVPTDTYQLAESPALAALSPAPADSTILANSLVPTSPTSPLPSESLLAQSPLPTEDLVLSQSPKPAQSPLPPQSPLPTNFHIAAHSPLPSESPAEVENIYNISMQSPIPTEPSLPVRSPLSRESSVPAQSALLTESFAAAPAPLSAESPAPAQSPLPTEALAPAQSPIPRESPLPSHSPVPTASPLPTDLLSTEEFHGTPPLPKESPSPSQSPVLIESLITVESLLPVDSTSIVESSIPPESLASVDPPLLKELSLPVEDSHLSKSPLFTESSHRTETTSHISSLVTNEIIHSTETASIEFNSEKIENRFESRLTPEIPHEQSESEWEQIHVQDLATRPTPDLVPEVRDDALQTRSELVTDIDIGIPESRAQEICVPVTSEIEQEEAVHPAAGTPPPTPAIEPPQPPTSLNIPPLSDTPIAADESREACEAAPIEAITAGVAAAAAAATVVAVAATAVKSKTPTTKKSPITPTSAVKSASKQSITSRTPTSAARKLTATTTAKTPTSATKLTPVTKTASMSARPPATKSITPKAPTPRLAAKNSAAPAKDSTLAAKTATATRAAPAPRAAPKQVPPKPVFASKTTATRPATAPASKPAAAPKTVPSRPATTTRAAAPVRAAPAARAASRPVTLAAKPKDATTKSADKKPLTNGDVKVPLKKIAPPTARAPPRAVPRAPAITTITTATAAKPAAPKPAPRAAAPRPALDKQSKDLANKRITAKTAPPRTATTKASPGTKSAASKPTAIRKSAAEKPAPQANGLVNGAGEPPSKPPPSPPAADNALLPDVIA